MKVCFCFAFEIFIFLYSAVLEQWFSIIFIPFILVVCWYASLAISFYCHFLLLRLLFICIYRNDPFLLLLISDIRHPKFTLPVLLSYSNSKALVRGMKWCRKMLYFNLKSFLSKRISMFDCISIFQCMNFLSFCRWHSTYV